MLFRPEGSVGTNFPNEFRPRNSRFFDSPHVLLRVRGPIMSIFFSLPFWFFLFSHIIFFFLFIYSSLSRLKIMAVSLLRHRKPSASGMSSILRGGNLFSLSRNYYFLLMILLFDLEKWVWIEIFYYMSSGWIVLEWFCCFIIVFLCKFWYLDYFLSWREVVSSFV